MGRKPSKAQVEAAKREIDEEDARALDTKRNSYLRAEAENRRRSNLPPEHPDHICGMFCDGQDGSNSYCARLRRKLFPPTQ